MRRRRLHHSLVSCLLFAVLSARLHGGADNFVSVAAQEEEGGTTTSSRTKVHVYEGPSATGDGRCDEGDAAKPGDWVQMHYSGSIDESSSTGDKGKEFYTSSHPKQFQIGVGEVMPGVDAGVVGLCKGDKATLVIPPEEGYGEFGSDNQLGMDKLGMDVPGGATLKFDVEILDVSESRPRHPDLKVDVYEGDGCDEADRVQEGQFLKVHYTGSIDESSSTGEKGKQFESSREFDREPLDVQIGIGQVLAGWDQGLVGLCKGDKVVLVVPPDAGYGEDGFGDDIPGGATLHFDIEIVDVSDETPPEPDLFGMADANGDGQLDKDEVEAFFESQGMPVPEGLWEEEDVNGDGFISWDEFGGPKGHGPPSAFAKRIFDDIDADEDGRLSKAEVSDFFEKSDAHDTPEHFWEQEDSDGDGYISFEEFAASVTEEDFGEVGEEEEEEEPETISAEHVESNKREEL